MGRMNADDVQRSIGLVRVGDIVKAVFDSGSAYDTHLVYGGKVVAIHAGHPSPIEIASPDCERHLFAHALNNKVEVHVVEAPSAPTASAQEMVDAFNADRVARGFGTWTFNMEPPPARLLFAGKTISDARMLLALVFQQLPESHCWRPPLAEAFNLLSLEHALLREPMMELKVKQDMLEIESQLDAANKVVANLRSELDEARASFNGCYAKLTEERKRGQELVDQLNAEILRLRRRVDGVEDASPVQVSRMTSEEHQMLLRLDRRVFALEMADADRQEEPDDDEPEHEEEEVNVTQLMREHDQLQTDLEDASRTISNQARNLSDKTEHITKLTVECKTLRENAQVGSDVMRKERDAARASLAVEKQAREQMASRLVGREGEISRHERTLREVARSLRVEPSEPIGSDRKAVNICEQATKLWEAKEDYWARKERAESLLGAMSSAFGIGEGATQEALSKAVNDTLTQRDQLMQSSDAYKERAISQELLHREKERQLADVQRKALAVIEQHSAAQKRIVELEQELMQVKNELKVEQLTGELETCDMDRMHAIQKELAELNGGG